MHEALLLERQRSEGLEAASVRLQHKLQEAAAEVEASTREATARKQESAKLKAELSQLRRSDMGALVARREGGISCALVASELAQAEAAIVHERARASRLQRDADGAQQRYDSLRAHMAHVTVEAASARASRESVEEAVSAHAAELRASLEARMHTEVDAERERGARRVHELEASLEAERAARDALRAERASDAAATKALRDELEALRRATHTRQAASSASDAELKTLQAELSEAQQQVLTTGAALQELISRHSDHEVEISRELSTARARINEMGEEAAEASAKLQAAAARQEQLVALLYAERRAREDEQASLMEAQTRAQLQASMGAELAGIERVVAHASGLSDAFDEAAQAEPAAGGGASSIRSTRASLTPTMGAVGSPPLQLGASPTAAPSPRGAASTQGA